MKTELNTETPSTNLVTEFLKAAKINWPKFTGKAKGLKEQEQLTKSDLDFLKSFMSTFLGHGEEMLKVLKSEADFYKKDGKAHSDLYYSNLKKAKARMKKLAELQRKIKRLR